MNINQLRKLSVCQNFDFLFQIITPKRTLISLNRSKLLSNRYILLNNPKKCK